MKGIYVFIIFCFAGVLGTAVTMVFGLNWSCMVATMIIIPGIALSLDLYFREKRERDEKLYVELLRKENALNEFSSNFGLDKIRAERFYNSGYHDLSDFKDKSAEELMQIDEINPTLANRIVRRMREI